MFPLIIAGIASAVAFFTADRVLESHHVQRTGLGDPYFHPDGEQPEKETSMIGDALTAAEETADAVVDKVKEVI